MSALDDLAARFGIHARYHDLHGHERAVNPDTQKALLRANGLDVSNDAVIRQTLDDLNHRDHDRWFPDEVIISSNQPHALGFGLGTVWHVVCTETGIVAADGRAGDRIELPALPSGIYDLVASASGRTETVTLIVAPPQAPSLTQLTGVDRLWGVNAALYGLGDAGDLGSFVDLECFGRVFADNGASFVGVNPLHAFGTMATEVISPYSPSSRFALNTCHIVADQVPGLPAAPEPPELAGCADAGIDYVTFKARHGATLEAQYQAFCERADGGVQAQFRRFAADSGSNAAQFALYEAISETEGADWRNWRVELRDADAAALADIRAKRTDRIAFHTWLQWVAEHQLAATQDALLHSGMPLGLYLDLAVGARRSGAESWCERSSVATGVSIGAPPDHLSPEGQNWDLTAFAPRQMKAQKYSAFRQLLRTVMRHAGVLRIDHVLGLNRSFWIPDDGSPGGYITQPFDALTAIIRIEAERAETLIIGEDLGLVPDGFRDTMRGQGVYGYSVLQYEKDGAGGIRDPKTYDPQIMACFGTHDTPTVEGYRTGRDIEWWQSLDWVTQDQAANTREARETEIGAITAFGSAETGVPPEKVFGLAVHTSLADAPPALVSVQLDDIFGNIEAQNLPGTIDQHPNWRRSYGTTAVQLRAHPGLASVANLMRAGGRASPRQPEQESYDED